MRPSVQRLALVGLFGLGLIGCTPLAGPSPDARQTRARAGKAELFGDALQLPTRAGERARQELALAGELERALVELDVEVDHVDVRLAAGEDPGAVTMIIRSPSGDPGFDETIRGLAAAMVPDVSPAEVHLIARVESSPTASAPIEAKPDAPAWALLLTAIGLGLSLGVSIERARNSRR